MQISTRLQHLFSHILPPRDGAVDQTPLAPHAPASDPPAPPAVADAKPEETPAPVVDLATLIRDAKAQVKAKEFAASAALATQIMDLAPDRREGYRIYAESCAKGEINLGSAYDILRRGYGKNLLTADMRDVHLRQILTAAIHTADTGAAVSTGADLLQQGNTDEIAALFLQGPPQHHTGTSFWRDVLAGVVARVTTGEQHDLLAILKPYQDMLSTSLSTGLSNPAPKKNPAQNKPIVHVAATLTAKAPKDDATSADTSAFEQLQDLYPKLQAKPDALGLWKQAGDLVGRRDVSQRQTALEELVRYAHASAALPLDRLGMLLAGFSQKSSYNALVPSPERQLAIDLLLAAYEKSGKSELANAAFSILLGLNDLDGCTRILNLWQAKSPKDAHQYISRSRLAVAHEDLDASLTYAQDAVTCAPESAATHRRVSHAYQSLSAYSAALSHLQIARDIRPQDVGMRQEADRLQQEVSAIRAFAPEPFDGSHIVPLAPDSDLRQLTQAAQATAPRHRTAPGWVLIAPSEHREPLQNDLGALETLPGGAAFYFGGCTSDEPAPSASDWALLPQSTLQLLLERGARSGQACLEDLRRHFRGCYLPLAAALRAGIQPPVEQPQEAPKPTSTPVFTAAAAQLMAQPPEAIDPASVAQMDTSQILVATPQDWSAIQSAVHLLDLHVVMLIPAGFTDGWGHLLDPDVVKNTSWLAYASSLIFTDLKDEERFEDRVQIAAPVYDSYEDGLTTACAVAQQRVCLAIGAGLGNMLFVTPLIREIAETTGCPVDLVVNSPVSTAVQLFGESPFVNIVCTTDRCRRVAYDKVFVTSCFGNVPFGLRTKKRISQRPAYDFMTRTRDMNEAEYNFLSAETLFPGLTQPKSLAGRMFIRAIDPRPAPRAGAQPVIGVSGPKKTDLWSRRQWSKFPELVQAYHAEGTDIRAFGLPGEDIDGALDCTSGVLRQSIRAMADCDLFICGDGGIFHIADALGLDTVAIFGPTSAIKNGPVNGRTTVLQSDMACVPCQYNQSFMDCRYTACMSAITPQQVRDIVKRRLAQDPDPELLHLPDSARQKPAGNFRFAQSDKTQCYQMMQLGQKATHTLFDSALRHNRLARAQHHIEWIFTTGSAQNTDWLKRARLTLRRGEFAEALQICGAQAPFAPTQKAAAEWLRMQLEALLKTHDTTGVLTLWQDRMDSFAPAPDDKGLRDIHSRIHWNVAQALLRLGRWQEAYTEIETALSLDPKLTSAQKALLSFKSASYNSPEERAKITGDTKPRLLISSTVSARETLSAWRDQFEIFRAEDELPASFAGFSAVIRHQNEDPAQPLEACLINDGILAAPRKLPQVLKALSTAGTPQSGSDKKRIVVVAHHHLELWNPRGGERSTHNIVSKLQEQGHDILVVVENKKNEEVGCEICEGLPYVLAGRYALKQTLEDVLDTWMPDAAILYGETALRAYETLLDRNVPYQMFPRDWQEICPRPYTNLLNRNPLKTQDGAFYHLLNGAAEVITNSNYVGEVIRHLHDLPSINSYVPVEHPERGGRHDPNGPILLVNPRKMNGGALVMKLAKEMPHRRFRVVGDYGKPFPPNVDVEPFFNGRYEDLYDGSSVFLFPLIGEDPCGTGRVVFEALHCGVPSISMDIGGMKEVLPPEWLVAGEDPQEWSVAIEQILADPDASARCDTLLGKFEADAQFAIVNASLKRILNNDA